MSKPEVPRLEAEPQSACCLSCRFGLFDGQALFCRRYPPILFLLSVNPNPQGGISPNFLSQFPPVGLGNWCGDYEGGEPALTLGGVREGLQ